MYRSPLKILNPEQLLDHNRLNKIIVFICSYNFFFNIALETHFFTKFLLPLYMVIYLFFIDEMSSKEMYFFALDAFTWKIQNIWRLQHITPLVLSHYCTEKRLFRHILGIDDIAFAS